IDVVWLEAHRRCAARAALCGPHTEGRQPGQLAGRAAKPVLPHHQPEDREGHRACRSRVVVAAGGSSDRVTTEGLLATFHAKTGCMASVDQSSMKSPRC